MLPHPIIFVPGITASYLRDYYPLPPEYVWTVLKKEYDRVALHPKDWRYEFKEPAMVRPDQVFEIAYREMVEELRDELKETARNVVPVYAFNYDWRQPLDATQQKLAQFVDEVVNRTRLLPHYQKAYGDKIKVNLLGHSMGGLVISRCLTDQTKQLPINKIMTLATPFQGSFESIVKITIGTGNLGKGKPSHAERRAARVTPSLYQLLPAFNAGIEIDSTFPQTLFKVDAWQPSVLSSIERYIKETGLSTGNIKSDSRKLFKELLDTAATNAHKIKNLKLASHKLTDRD